MISQSATFVFGDFAELAEQRRPTLNVGYTGFRGCESWTEVQRCGRALGDQHCCEIIDALQAMNLR